MNEKSNAPANGTWIPIGALSAFLAVALGAFGAHFLRTQIPPDRLDVFQTGAHYHLIHSLALVFVGLLATQDANSRAYNQTGMLFAAGILLFSGSLYLLALTGIRGFGAITPLGGICFLTAWALLAATSARRARN
jgi:uncharacterized membrane protein YgdD (TMEM256/DUF423 family)